MARPETLATRNLHVAVVGLEFGSAFVPLYRDHPGVGAVTVCDLDADRLHAVQERDSIARGRTDLSEVLADPAVDAVHVVTGIADHAGHVVRALEAGKHVASAVPMALSFEDLDRIVAARVASGRRYMMMETAAYTREYLYAAELVRSGTMGEIAYARGTHFQDMSGWPAYWKGLPPMHYATHAVAPILRMLDARASRVRALGSGTLRFEDQGDYRNPFAFETALIELADHPAVVEIARALYGFAHTPVESFSIYGERQSFEWAQLAGENPVLHEMAPATGGRGRPVAAHRVRPPDADHLLPVQLRGRAREAHGGSHPHLVHEFVSSVLEDRAPAIDDRTAANWTATGIAAHLSAMRGGDAVTIPTFGH
jgi:predicted dehydrogenase